MLDFDRPDLLSPRNLIAGLLCLLVMVGGWYGLQALTAGVDAPPPTVAEAPKEPEPPPEPEPEPDPEPPKGHRVLTAAHDLFAGDLIRPDMLEWRDWSETDLEDYALADLLIEDDVGEDAPALLRGAAVHMDMTADAPIQRRSIVLPGRPGYITALIKEGHRAVPVRVDDASANAGIIHPGDAVDVTMVFRQSGLPELADLGPVAQVIISDVTVLAIGSRLLGLRAYGSDLADNNNGGGAPAGNIYTLELTPRDADRLALATSTGEIKLSLRSSQAAGAESLAQRAMVGLDEVVTPPDRPGAAVASVRIIRGPSHSNQAMVAVDQASILRTVATERPPTGEASP